MASPVRNAPQGCLCSLTRTVLASSGWSWSLSAFTVAWRTSWLTLTPQTWSASRPCCATCNRGPLDEPRPPCSSTHSHPPLCFRHRSTNPAASVRSLLQVVLSPSVLPRCLSPADPPSKFHGSSPWPQYDLGPPGLASLAGGVRFYLFIYLFPTEGTKWYLMPHITEQTVCASDSITMSVLGSAWRRPKDVQCILPYSIMPILVPNILGCMLRFLFRNTEITLVTDM